MIKKCRACDYTGELTWRDGKYYCAMCGGEVAEDEPAVQHQERKTVNNITCPICKNRENNLFDGINYRCSLCETLFDPNQKNDVSYDLSNTNPGQAQQKKQKKKTRVLFMVLAIFCLFGAFAMLIAALAEEDGLMLFAGMFIYGIPGAMLLALAKTPKGSAYLFGAKKGIRQSLFVGICLSVAITGFVILALVANM